MNNERRRLSRTNSTAVQACGSPPSWLSTEDLDDLLFASILEQSGGLSEEDGVDLEEIDLYYSEDDLESEEDHRSSGLRLLAITAPVLADLLGGPAAELPS